MPCFNLSNLYATYEDTLCNWNDTWLQRLRPKSQTTFFFWIFLQRLKKTSTKLCQTFVACSFAQGIKFYHKWQGTSCCTSRGSFGLLLVLAPLHPKHCSWCESQIARQLFFRLTGTGQVHPVSSLLFHREKMHHRSDAALEVAICHGIYKPILFLISTRPKQIARKLRV